MPPRPQRNRNPATRAASFKRSRFWIVCLFFFAWALAIGGRLFWLQVVRHTDYVKLAQKQQQRAFEVAPRRGVLYDRNLRELAMTVQADSIYAVPSEIDDKNAAVKALAPLVHTDPEDAQTSAEQIAARLNKNNGFAWIARRVPNEVSAKVRELVKNGSLQGIYFQKEFQRFYPDNQIAAQVLGYVGVDDNGLGGLEQKFEPLLHGQPGRMYTAVDARRQVLGSSERDPAAGRNLVLTLDENIQFLAERALDHAMERTKANNGTIVIQDVHTGQILALAIRPTFNPNQFRHTTQDLLRNHAISDVYEPGSVFKLITYSAALESHVTTPDDIVDCQGGQVTVAGRLIHDDKGDHFGRITVHEALAHSSNVGAIKTALKVGPERFYQFIRDFGFGQRSGAELPGETRGLLRPVNKWSASSIASIAMGQEVGVTPIQLVAMVSTIANGGVYLPPHILMPGQLDPKSPKNYNAPQAFKPGGELPNPLPDGARRVLSPETAYQMRKMMEGVVRDGTGKEAQLNGYSSGGKTGTAQKIDPATHLYSKTMHIASFAGIAPVDHPVIAVAVVLDNPKGGYYAATVSAPVFADVAQQVLEYLGVPHDAPLRPAKSQPVVHLAEDDADEHTGDAQALFSAVNDLPGDDPLRGTSPTSAPVAHAANTSASNAPAMLPAPANANAQTAQTMQPPQAPPKTSTIVIDNSRKVNVPSLIGLPMRKAIEAASAAGLNLRISGSGTVRRQSPAAGTTVAAGTPILVQCKR